NPALGCARDWERYLISIPYHDDSRHHASERMTSNKEGQKMNATTQFQNAQPFPGPKGYPLVGVIPKIKGNFINFMTQMWLEYGDCLRLDMGKVEMYCVVHPDDVKHVLQMNNRNYAKGHKNQVKVLFGNGLFSSEGEFWRQQRRLIQPLFNRRTLGSYVPAIIASTAEMLARWEARPEPTQALDIADEMRRVTQRVITRTMFSKDMSEQTDMMCEAFTEALDRVNGNMRRPDFMNKWPIPSNRRFEKAINTIDETVYKLIAERRASDASDASDNAEEQDLLSLLLNVRDEESGAGMSDQQIRDELTTIFLAGHETTATGLTWTWYLLSRHPVVGEKVLAEVEHVLAGRMPRGEDLAKLTYTRQVFEESLRLYPPVWRFVRLAEEDDVLPSGYRIPKGSMVMLSPYLTHRHPDFWRNSEGFQPSRFTQDASKIRHRYAYLPFGGGPRLCIGNNFSLMEGPLMMAMILQQYKLVLMPGSNVQMKPSVMRPLNGMPMLVTPRREAPMP
ncbi:MAG: cytochrome P450, partial [Ardenticatenaceae bacterium]